MSDTPGELQTTGIAASLRQASGCSAVDSSVMFSVQP